MLYLNYEEFRLFYRGYDGNHRSDDADGGRTVDSGSCHCPWNCGADRRRIHFDFDYADEQRARVQNRMRGAFGNQLCDWTFVHNIAAANGDFCMASYDLHFRNLRARFRRSGNSDRMAASFRRFPRKAACNRNHFNVRFGIASFHAAFFVRIYAHKDWRRGDDFGGRVHWIFGIQKPRHRCGIGRNQGRGLKTKI